METHTGFLGSLRRIVGLEIHEDATYLTRRTVTAMHQAMVVWLVLFLFEWYAWAMAGRWMFQGNILFAAIFGLVVPIVVLVFDMSLYTTDLNEFDRREVRRFVGVRLAAVLLFNLITATPFAMQLFRDEIEQQLATEARATAKTHISVEFDTRIAAVEKNHVAKEAQRKQELAKLEERFERERASLKDRLDSYDAAITEEAQNPDRPGYGTRALGYREDRSSLETQMDALARRQQEERATVERSSAGIQALEQIATRIRQLEAERNKRVDELASMPRLTLIRRWTSDGFLARRQALQTLMGSSTIFWSVMVIHLMVVMLGLIAFTMKFLHKHATEAYYSTPRSKKAAAAWAEAERARQVIAAALRERLEALLPLIVQFGIRMREIFGNNPDKSRSLYDYETELRVAFDKDVRVALALYQSTLAQANAVGYRPPAWPSGVTSPEKLLDAIQSPGQHEPFFVAHGWSPPKRRY